MRDARALVLLLATLAPALSSCAPGHSFFTRGHDPTPPLAAPRAMPGASSMPMGFITSHILSGIAASRIAASATKASLTARRHCKYGNNCKKRGDECHDAAIAIRL
ncbi:hypothetical protein T484DRAFT_1746365 [Baffinella frigidus]|nr:hypothetical protein T484DRAFT_1746365 [Cryptophyta sp. CCMP2293]